MGYYTTHNITEADDHPDFNAALRRLVEITNYSMDFFIGGEPCKWYEEEHDMKALSLEFPHLTFRVDGEGEGTGDIWVHWYRNGRQIRWQAPDIVLPDNPGEEEWGALVEEGA